MRFYVIYMGEGFEEAVERHGDFYFKSPEEALEYGKLMLEPGQKFWVCDENGGVVIICQAPRIVGRT